MLSTVYRPFLVATRIGLHREYASGTGYAADTSFTAMGRMCWGVGNGTPLKALRWRHVTKQQVNDLMLTSIRVHSL